MFSALEALCNVLYKCSTYLLTYLLKPYLIEQLKGICWFGVIYYYRRFSGLCLVIILHSLLQLCVLTC